MLTDAQIDAIWSDSNPTNFEARSFARAIERAVEAGASGAAQDAKRCHWAFEEDVTEAWVTGCGNLFSFTGGGPKENEFKFCCYCGGAIDEAVEAQQRGSDAITTTR